MKLSEAKADLGAPDGEGNFPMSKSFDADLARANLLRMRAEYRQAEDLCLSILKQHPNSIEAHTLLGDIYSDQGLLEQSAQWYELALDLDPSSVTDRQKLDDVRDQIRERDHISSIEQLGLPEPLPRNKAWLSGMAVACLVLLLAAGFAFRHGKFGGSGEPAVITTPIRALPDNSAARVASVPSQSTHTFEPATTPPVDYSPPSLAPFEDRALAQLVTQHSSVSSHLVSVLQDPRAKIITLTYSCGADEDERRIGAMLARTALEQSPDSIQVTIRMMRNDRLSYMADVLRSRLDETLNQDWQTKAGSLEAWIPYVLTNEWPKPPADTTTNAAANSGGDSTPPTTTSGTGSGSGTGSTTDSGNGLTDPSQLPMVPITGH